jgi:hypothetical protein
MGSYLLPTTPRTSSCPLIGLVRTVVHWSGTGNGAGVVTPASDDRLLGNDQRQLADVPVGQVRGAQRLACGHGVANLLTELVPGIAAGVGVADVTGDLIEFVCHGEGPSGGEWARPPVLFAFWQGRFGPV